jgi:hypothetical protein
LVLDISDGTSSNPVDLRWGGEVISVSDVLLDSGGVVLVSEQLVVLEVIHISEVVDGKVVGSVLGVVSLDVVVGLGELFKSVVVLLFGAIESSVLSDELDEFMLSLSHDGGIEGDVLGVESVESGESGGGTNESNAGSNI